ncbi:uncharacterized protein LOC115631840 [Scaptodrosophila lebanonensis]|uniref:Cytidine deaminase n=1 Tax=Drosophila lebanonensis TaxID=7225 RepID=A0A6J2UAN6_DROLE|nr:uncharacterized protein LOC115631840 [Scaptodrosophila lebanonensis]
MPKRNSHERLSKRLQKYLTRLNELKFEVDKRQCLSGRDVVPPKKKVLPECIVRFCELDFEGRQLVEAALIARLKAYAPYSKFKVGAAFRSKAGDIFTGCNIENVAFTPSCCAERTALVKAVSEEHTTFTGGAVVAYHPDAFITPCGVCRQFILEFAKKDIPIYVASAPEHDDALPMIEDEHKVLITSIYNLMPRSFSSFE